MLLKLVRKMVKKSLKMALLSQGCGLRLGARLQFPLGLGKHIFVWCVLKSREMLRKAICQNINRVGIDCNPTSGFCSLRL